jgi:hypothetical protein
MPGVTYPPKEFGQQTLECNKSCIFAKGAKEVLTCVLASKPSSLQLPNPANLGFDLPHACAVNGALYITFLHYP